MRRSSTTASLATVRRRLQGEKLLQNSSEANSPSKPPTIRMIPTVTPPQTLRVCRQGCYRQVMPSPERTRPAVRPLRPWLRPGVAPRLGGEGYERAVAGRGIGPTWSASVVIGSRRGSRPECSPSTTARRRPVGIAPAGRSPGKAAQHPLAASDAASTTTPGAPRRRPARSTGPHRRPSSRSSQRPLSRHASYIVWALNRPRKPRVLRPRFHWQPSAGDPERNIAFVSSRTRPVMCRWAANADRDHLAAGGVPPARGLPRGRTDTARGQWPARGCGTPPPTDSLAMSATTRRCASLWVSAQRRAAFWTAGVCPQPGSALAARLVPVRGG
jgi:hypothetical protein